MDAVCFDVLRRALAGLALAGDTGRGLDALLTGFLDTLAGLPELRHAAVVLADGEGRPVIRARHGEPDVALVLAAALERGPAARVPRVLRHGAAPVLADAAGDVAVGWDEAAMLAAPILNDDAAAEEQGAHGASPAQSGPVGQGAPMGWFFANALVGRTTALGEELRFLALLATLAGRLAALAATGGQRARDMARELAFLRSKVSLRYEHVFSHGAGPSLDGLRGEVSRLAVADTPLVFRGESGCGRAVLARIVHELSPRAVQPFSVFDAATATRPMERLFGEVRPLGPTATPAVSGPGLLETTDGGTLFIREAHHLSPEVCEHLVRFRETGRLMRLGDLRERHADTRLFFGVSPAGLNPELMAALGPETLAVPSLRERREDIPALLDHLLTREASRGGRRLTLTPKALRALEGYDWPGNIREMEGLVSRLAVTAIEDRVDIADIPPEMLAEGDRPQVLPEDAAELRDMERQQVLSALERHGWVQSRAARELGLTLRQIGYRIRKYGLSREGDDA